MIKKVGFSLLGLIFLLFAYFQWNDLDSLKWIIYYVLISLLAFLTVLDRNKLLYIYMMLAVTVVWMVFLTPAAMDWVSDGMPSIVESMKASSPYIELVREFLGLGISLLALIILLFVEKKDKNFGNLTGYEKV